MKLFRAIIFSFVLFLSTLCSAQLNTARVMEIGRNALYFEDYVLSIQYFNQVIDSKPFLHEPYFFRGLAKFYLDDFVGACEDFTSAIDRNPYVAQCYQLRGMCHARMDSVALAEKDFRMAIKYDMQNPNLWQNLGVLTMQSGDWEKAALVVDSLLVFSPRNSAAYLLRTQISLNMGDTLHAFGMAEKAVQYDKYSAEVYDARAIVLCGMGDYEAAEKDLDRAVELMPARGNSYVNRALVRYHRNNLRGAMEDYDMALYVEPTNFIARYNRGLLRMNVGADNLAIEDFDKVLEIDPDNTMARFNRALLRENVGDCKGAVEDYDRVISDYPNFEYAYSCRASARRKCGDKKGAEADEKWLFKRQLDIYNKGVDVVNEEYSAENDNTRKRSDANVRNYNKMVVADDVYTKQYTTEYRGKVQDRNVFVELEPVFVLSYYKNDSELEALSHYCKPLEELNASLVFPLLITNDERALSENEIGRSFDNINNLSKRIAENSSATIDIMLRAINYYLVQDLETAMLDLDYVLSHGGASWELYFVRSFVRYKLLEAGRFDKDGDSGNYDNSVVNLDYRLVKSDLDKVLELYPDFVYAFFNRANVFAKMNDYKSAIVDYTKAIELNDRFAEAYFNRGLARLYIGNSEQGIADLSKAGELGIFQAYNVIKRFVYSANGVKGVNED